jgi:hypothetical protein
MGGLYGRENREGERVKGVGEVGRVFQKPNPSNPSTYNRAGSSLTQ